LNHGWFQTAVGDQQKRQEKEAKETGDEERVVFATTERTEIILVGAAAAAAAAAVAVAETVTPVVVAIACGCHQAAVHGLLRS
jgi:hypothetical protein